MLPLYQTAATLVFAYVLMFLPRALTGLRSSIAQTPVELERAAMSLGRPPLMAVMQTTMRLAAPGVAASVALVALGIANKERLWRPLPTLLDVVANLPLTVPAALLGFGFLFAFTNPAIALYGTRTSLILAYMTIMIPYSVRYQLSTLPALGRQTIEASQVSGASAVRTFFQVTLPLSRAGIVSSAAIMFVLLTHEFGVSLLLRAPNVNVMSVVASVVSLTYVPASVVSPTRIVPLTSAPALLVTVPVDP